jgi:replication factor C large subunit
LHVSWTQKYRPSHLSEIAGNQEAIRTLREWLATWSASPRKRKAALLYGPPGTGKTVSAEASSKDLNYDLVEMNASDQRTTASIEKIVGIAIQQRTLTAVKRLILLDEVDGIDPSTDRGAVAAMSAAIESTKWPIILTANDPWDPRLAPLRNVCLTIQFKRLGLRDTLPYLKKICEKEGIAVEEKALRFIVERNEGDMRSILNDMQTLAAGRKKLTYDEVTWLGWRDRKDSIFDVLATVFNAKTCRWARKAIDLADVDYEMLFEWIYENAPTQLTDPGDRAKALEALALADLYIARIRKTQDWSLLAYALDLMTGGVAMSREQTKPGWIKMRFPERIKLLSRLRRHRALRTSIGRKIASKCHISTAGAIRYYMPYVKQLLESDLESAEAISTWLELDEDMKQYLSDGPTAAKKSVTQTNP